MQLISCTHCHRTWEHVEEKNPSYKDDHGVYVQSANDTPCFHHYTVDVDGPLHASKSVFTVVPYIPTLTDTIDAEFVGMLLKKGVSEKNLIKFYHDIVDENFTGSPLDGEGAYIREMVQYRGREVEHLAYYESENTLYVFTVPQLRVLAYLYKKNPIALCERIEEWYKTAHQPIEAEESF